MSKTPHNYYYGIFGNNVTKGARSPLLWNSKFNQMSVQRQMVPFNSSREDFDFIFERNLENSNFKGGLLAAPVKDIPKILSYKLSNRANLAQSVNAFRIKNEQIECDNFDGAAALEALLTDSPTINLKESKIAILGSGPLSRIILVELRLLGLELSQVHIYSHDILKSKLSNQIYDLHQFSTRCSDYQIVFNGTKLGHSSNNYSPIDSSTFLKMSEKLIYFDANYIIGGVPEGVRIARNCGVHSIDGSIMNHIQAENAFAFVNYDLII